MHTSVLRACQVQRKESVPSLSQRGILCRQDCTPAQTANCTPIRLHTRSDPHPLPSSTYLLSELHQIDCIACQSELEEILFRPPRKREKSKSIFHKKKSLLILLLYPISILSSKVIHNGSIHKYTQLLMLTHYSPLRLPSVTLGHKHNQTPPHDSNRSIK